MTRFFRVMMKRSADLLEGTRNLASLLVTLDRMKITVRDITLDDGLQE